MSRRNVSMYGLRRFYGGTEEGGWWFTVTKFIESYRLKSTEKAKRYCHKKNEEDNRRKAEAYGCDRLIYVRESRQHLGELDDTDKPRPTYC